MEVFDLQSKVYKFVKENNLETKIESRLLDLVSEVGELSKEVLKGSNYGKEKFENTDEWINEFGDVLFSLICIANKTEINLEVALDKALNKYGKRFNEKGNISSGK
ncbi:MazG nucleotide pyrophosphohydrolase domain-containing protein [Halonatronum saccharophilum]|uniref:MazG nucleotide pyrophosphohydrolase domain-containing protein n=1 Tax=Halonatronum saccharophilum TaxID=150060 RepID=UPI000488F613|nr:MazG nucleotide pyrophosphohydrolase domain-containing protein [Halonatronum saccharophilum]